MWMSHVVNQYNLVLMLQLLCILPESTIRVRAQYVCESGHQEKAGKRWRWVLTPRDPCLCTKVKFGGLNAYTPKQPFDPVYVDNPFVKKFKKHFGLNCTDEDECASNPCYNGGTCTDGVNSYTCHCLAGYEGINCHIDEDECASNPCYNGGTCMDGVNSYTCQCMSGYAGFNCDISMY
ncbi:uncharacterized protein [Amphiura filiformis]|uniref:uncharacterized protein n=1 Tax=Amphiura filiformis TaxID=82378 RepID=UPI003B2201F2